MRGSLLKSAFIVFGFWWLIFLLSWGFSSPEHVRESLLKIYSVLPFVSFEEDPEATLLSSWADQLKVIALWTTPLLIVSGLAILVGAGMAGRKGFRIYSDRKVREAGDTAWRDVTVSLGNLPLPPVLKADPLELDPDTPITEQLSPPQLLLLEKILGVLSAHPGAYCGEGHGVSILDHTVNRLTKLSEQSNVPPLAVLISACLDLGKITAYGKKGDNWEQRRNIEAESARIVGSLEEWWALTPEDRTILTVAVKFSKNPKIIPDFDGNDSVKRKIWKLLDVGKTAELKATEEEKQKVLEMHELPPLMVEGFLSVLADMPFQVPGLAKNIKAAGWKKKGRLYLLEIQVRERTVSKLNTDIAAALGGSYREKSKLAPFTNELLKGLDQKGWLIKEIDGVRVRPKEALWKIKAGTHEFKGVIIIDIQPEFADKLPRQDTLYEIEVVGPQFGAQQKEQHTPAEKPQKTEKPGTGGAMASIAGLDLSDVLSGGAPVLKDPKESSTESPSGDVPPKKNKKSVDPSVLGDLLS